MNMLLSIRNALTIYYSQAVFFVTENTYNLGSFALSG